MSTNIVNMATAIRWALNVKMPSVKTLILKKNARVVAMVKSVSLPQVSAPLSNILLLVVMQRRRVLANLLTVFGQEHPV